MGNYLSYDDAPIENNQGNSSSTIVGGSSSSTRAPNAPTSPTESSGPTFFTIRDRYESLEQVQQSLRQCGLESSNLILGIDYTKSNQWTGARSFGNRCLHDLQPDTYNPYQTVIDVISRTLEEFDDDRLIPAYGFGDISTSDREVFPFWPDERPCFGVAEVLARYNEVTQRVQLSGPTSFKPIIEKAIDIVKQTGQYHILVIVADGQVSDPPETRRALVKASHYPLSVIVVGVGDGPWDEMELLDDGLSDRKFDNLQFVEFEKAIHDETAIDSDVNFALHALMEIPDQYRCIKKLGLLSKVKQ